MNVRPASDSAKRLSPRQARAAVALAGGATQAAAAKAAGVAAKTVQRWAADEVFRERVRAEGRNLIAAQRRGIRALLVRARQVVADLLDEEALTVGQARRGNLAMRALTVAHLASYAFGDGGPGVERHEHDIEAEVEPGPVLLRPGDDGWEPA